ncbi:hypothetical protein FI667_g14657, partial [Globisporangium splendens]
MLEICSAILARVHAQELQRASNALLREYLDASLDAMQDTVAAMQKLQEADDSLEDGRSVAARTDSVMAMIASKMTRVCAYSSIPTRKIVDQKTLDLRFAVHVWHCEQKEELKECVEKARVGDKQRAQFSSEETEKRPSKRWKAEQREASSDFSSSSSVDSSDDSDDASAAESKDQCLDHLNG